MNSLQLKLALRVAVFGLPYLLLMSVGGLWLYEQGLILPFALGSIALAALGWVLLWWLESRPTPPRSTPPPSETWPEAGQKAWSEVERLRIQVEAVPPPFDQANAWVELFGQVFEVVARQFHPQSQQPALEVSAAEALRVAELVARDLRTFLQEQVPGSDRITIHNIQRVLQWRPLAQQLAGGAYNVYRLARLVINPPAALANEAKTALLGGDIANVVADLPRMAAGYVVRQTGQYAIQLYSGQMSLADAEWTEFGADKPIRMVILGQTKAGKSSLINALFGRIKAATDVLPCTDSITPYVLGREDLPQAIVLDTIGLAGKGDAQARQKLDAEIARCDLIVLVSSANNAARDVDHALLEEVRQRFAALPRRAAPPVVVALSHIDRVRPINEWRPPYDFLQGESAKERNVREAVDTVSQDLQVSRDLIVPVCLREDSVYNVEEGLVPLFMQVLPDTERAKLLRLLMDARDAEQRQALTRQLVNAGLSLAQLGAYVVRNKLRPASR
ncbi:MAG: GTPase domain-containing protein [Pirellulales bacterium]|nr:GTPase domain-containing protein [Pirellulales bacterium]